MKRHLALVAADGVHFRDEVDQDQLQKLRQVVVHLTKLSAIGTTATMIVHEVTQPVTAATNYLGAAHRLLQKSDPTAKEQALQAVELAQEALLRTAEIMRDVKEAAANKAFSPQPLDLHVVLADIMKIYSPSWDLTPKVVLATTACHVIGDRIQLAQVLSNLIRNAMEVTEGQSERRLRVSSRLTPDDFVEVRVEDNGPGVPQFMRPKLFSAFHSSKADGLGVGLSICRAIVEQHSGEIWAESLPDGTAFCFTLPAADPHGYGEEK
jgi:two-component system sensor kinase FixL